MRVFLRFESGGSVSWSSARTTKRFPSRCASTIQIVRAVGTHVPSREVCHNGREYWDGTETLKSWGEKSLQSLVTLLRLAASSQGANFVIDLDAPVLGVETER
jgi:hypothetical protein